MVLTELSNTSRYYFLVCVCVCVWGGGGGGACVCASLCVCDLHLFKQCVNSSTAFLDRKQNVNETS